MHNSTEESESKALNVGCWVFSIAMGTGIFFGGIKVIEWVQDYYHPDQIEARLARACEVSKEVNDKLGMPYQFRNATLECRRYYAYQAQRKITEEK